MGSREPDVKAIFLGALDRPAGPDREAYLEDACGGDAALRRRVDDLLAAHDRAAEILGPTDRTGLGRPAEVPTLPGEPTGAPGAARPPSPAGPEESAPLGLGPEPAETLVGPPPREAPETVDLGRGRSPDETGSIAASAGDPDRGGLSRGEMVRYFGDYEIRRPLGRGGMGVVYRARQVSLNRPVALKMIRAGLLAGDDELRRFQNEAEAVALLDHPGIVPVFEVGEHDGQKYFSMKLVDGGSLADRLGRYAADPRAAALLLAEAAEAVAHAHARGILHRDLKPANILVDAEGHPHVTDFGLAKRVEADVELTASGAILGTPAYMAPEQATGRRGAITTATDVHGLGAVLYALLTGRGPFGGDSVVETIDAVRTRPPEPPRRLNARVPRDLETICLKCLEKDPRRRYPTAQALADDLRCWLGSRPIAARRVGLAERGWLWCRRKPTVAALAATVLLATVGGTAATIVVQERANRALEAKNDELSASLRREEAANDELSAANDRVRQRYELAVEAIKTFHTGVAEDFLIRQDQFRDLRDRLLNSAGEFYDRLGALLGEETDLASRRSLARANFDRSFLTGKIGRLDDALAGHRAVLEARRAHAAEPGADLEALADVGRSLTSVAGTLQALGRSAEALEVYREAERTLEAPAGASPGARAALAYCRSSMGGLLSGIGRAPEALATYRLARDDQEALALGPDPTDEARRDLAETIERIALLLHETGDPAGSEAEHRRALEILGDLAVRNPADAALRSRLAANHHLLGMLLADTGKLPEAESHHRRAIDLQEALMASHPAVSEFRTNASNSSNDLATLLRSLGKPSEAEAAYRKAVALKEELVAKDPAATWHRFGLATCLNNLARLLQDTGRPAEAEAEQREAIALFEGLLAADPATGPRNHLAISRKNLGLMLIALDRLPEAEAEYRAALELTDPMAAADPEPGPLLGSRAGSRQAIALLLGRAGRLAEAEAECRAALASFEAVAERNPGFTENRSRLAGCLNLLGTFRLDAGDPAGADAAFRRALGIFEALGDESPAAQGFRIGIATGLANLADVDRLRGGHSRALERYEEALALFEALMKEDPAQPALQAALASALRRRGLSRAALADPSGAAEDARRALAILEALPSRKSDDWLATACCLSALSGLSGIDSAGVPVVERGPLADHAIALLRRAVALGYRNPGTFRAEAALDPLRGRDDFRLLMLDLAMPPDPFAAPR